MTAICDGGIPASKVLDATVRYWLRAYRITAAASRTAGATRVPTSSIARMSFACGSEDAFIWKLTRDKPPSASL